MRNIKYIGFGFLFWVVFCSNVLACSDSERSRLKNFASNVDYYYSFDESSQSFNLTLYNINKNVYIIDKDEVYSFYPSNEFNEYTINNISPSSNLVFHAYANNGECSDELLYSYYVSVPSFNKYYNSDVCLNSDSRLCNKWVNTGNMEYNDFLKRLKLDEKSSSKTVEEEETKVLEVYNFIQFLGDYYIYILLIIIIGGTAWIIVLRRKDRFDF